MNKLPLAKTAGKGLAAALAIAGGTSAYGNIVYVNPPADLTNVPGGSTTFAEWDVNGDGTDDFAFANRYPNTAPGTAGVVWQLSIFTGGINGVISYSGPHIHYAYALHYGGFVGPSDPRFSTTSDVIVLGSKYGYAGGGQYYYGGFAAGGPNGSVLPGQLAFAGFRFQAADGTHYGWIRLSVNAGIIDFADAAYDTIPNEQIFFPIDPPMPEPGTMALLALGAVGVIGAVAKRRRG